MAVCGEYAGEISSQNDDLRNQLEAAKARIKELESLDELRSLASKVGNEPVSLLVGWEISLTTDEKCYVLTPPEGKGLLVRRNPRFAAAHEKMLAKLAADLFKSTNPGHSS